MTDRRSIPPDDLVCLMLTAAAMAVLLRMRFFEALELRARRFGIAPGSERFDQAAEAAGMPYCRALDLYVDRETKARAEALHFKDAHLALPA